MTQYFKFLFFIGILMLSLTVEAQQRVKLQNADIIRGGTLNGESYRKLNGNVIFKQSETTIYSDSASLFPSRNSFEAFGRVRITEGDSTVITSRRLTYDGNARMAKLRTNVVYTKKGAMTLYTDNLDYNINGDRASYFGGGRLVDSTSVLTSESGVFDDKTGIATFTKNVVATFPDGVIHSQSLRYNTKTGIIYFLEPATLTNKDSTVIDYSEGEYDTRSKDTRLREGQIQSADYTIKADGLGRTGDIVKAVGNVILTATEDDVIITGNDALMNEKTGITKVFNNPLMKKPFDGDTLYLSADTLVAIDSEIDSEKRLLAYNNVKIYKKDLQGKADSLVYLQADSIIRFFNNPILWSTDNQMTADTISVYIANNTIDRMVMDMNSFVISQDTLDNFNQIKGRNMVSFFTEGNLSRVDVNGNCESIFYALEEVELYVIGMNKIICSNMNIFFQNNSAKKITSLTRPEATFTPPHELKVEETTLRGFNWQGDLRPTLQQMVSSQAEALKKTLPRTRPVQGREN